MLKRTLFLTSFCIAAAMCSSTESEKPDMNYTMLIIPDFCVPKLLSFDFECLQLIISKCLSLGILVGSLGFKVPQLLKIIKSKSTKGISSKAYIFELLSNSSNIIFFYYNGIPFKNYGENFSLLIQNFIGTIFDL